MKNYIKALISTCLIAFTSPALAFDEIPPGEYSIAISPQQCDILSDETITKRAYCATLMRIGTTTLSMTSNGSSLYVQGWLPSTYTLQDFSYSGSGSSMGIRVKSALLTFDKEGVINDSVYLPGSGTPDINVVYEVHIWAR